MGPLGKLKAGNGDSGTWMNMLDDMPELIGIAFLSAETPRPPLFAVGGANGLMVQM
jgi:hypothetical protein